MQPAPPPGPGSARCPGTRAWTRSIRPRWWRPWLSCPGWPSRRAGSRPERADEDPDLAPARGLAAHLGAETARVPGAGAPGPRAVRPGPGPDLGLARQRGGAVAGRVAGRGRGAGGAAEP